MNNRTLAEQIDRAIIRYGAMSRLYGKEGTRDRWDQCCAARMKITELMQQILPEYDPEKWARESMGFVDTAKTLDAAPPPAGAER